MQDLFPEVSGTRPCVLCGSTGKRECQFAWMHCTRPDGAEAKPRLSLSQGDRYWSWKLAADYDDSPS